MSDFDANDSAEERKTAPRANNHLRKERTNKKAKSKNKSLTSFNGFSNPSSEPKTESSQFEEKIEKLGQEIASLKAYIASRKAKRQKTDEIIENDKERKVKAMLTILKTEYE